MVVGEIEVLEGGEVEEDGGGGGRRREESGDEGTVGEGNGGDTAGERGAGDAVPFAAVGGGGGIRVEVERAEEGYEGDTVAGVAAGGGGGRRKEEEEEDEEDVH